MSIGVSNVANLNYQRIPITLEDNNNTRCFAYREEGLPQFLSTSCHNQTLSSTSVEREDIQRRGVNAPTEDGASQSASASVSAAMNQMVDSLVGSEIPENHTSINGISPYSTIWETTGSETNPIRQSYNQQKDPYSGNEAYAPGAGTPPAQSFSPRPALPSIMNTPFAPQPGEDLSPMTRPSTARQVDHEHQHMPLIGDPTSSYLLWNNGNNPLAQKSPSTPIDFPTSLSSMQTPWSGDKYGYIYGGLSGRPGNYGYHGDAHLSPYFNSFREPYDYPSNQNNNPANPRVGVIGQISPNRQGG